MADAEAQLDVGMKQAMKAKLQALDRSLKCAEQCTYKDWSFRTGLVLADECPSHCKLYKLQGPQPKAMGVTSRSRKAQEAIAEDDDVKNYKSNLIQLRNICSSGGRQTEGMSECQGLF